MGDTEREAAILARCEAATKGPWVECKPMCLAPVVRDSRGLYVCETRTTEPGGLVQPTHAETVSSHADAAFIAHAREDVPWLLAQLDAARARAERAEGALEPFAHPDLLKMTGGQCQGDDSPVYGRDNAVLKLGHFRAAARALAARGE